MGYHRGTVSGKDEHFPRGAFVYYDDAKAALAGKEKA